MCGWVFLHGLLVKTEKMKKDLLKIAIYLYKLFFFVSFCW